MSEKRPFINGDASTPQNLYTRDATPNGRRRRICPPGRIYHHRVYILVMSYSSSHPPPPSDTDKGTLTHTRLKLNECICRHGASVGTIGKNANNHRQCPPNKSTIDPLPMVLTRKPVRLLIRGGSCVSSDEFFFR